MTGRAKTKDIPIFDHSLFFNKIEKGEGCWLWIGSFQNNGYGRMKIKNSAFLAHRLSYYIFKGKLSSSLVIDHICRNRLCVNPDHLREVSQKYNSIENSSGVAFDNSRKTHCKWGHEFIPSNTYKIKGGRQCKQCVLDSCKKRRLNKKQK